MFKKGEFDLGIKQCSGQSQEFGSDKLQTLLNDDATQSVLELA